MRGRKGGRKRALSCVYERMRGRVEEKKISGSIFVWWKTRGRQQGGQNGRKTVIVCLESGRERRRKITSKSENKSQINPAKTKEEKQEEVEESVDKI